MKSDDDRVSDALDRLTNRAVTAEAELKALKAQIRGVIGTAGAEATAIGDAGDSGGWLTVVRVYAEALDTIGGLVDAERVGT